MKLIVLLLFVLAPAAVMAQSEVCSSSFTVNTVAVASHTATEIDSDSVVMADRKWVELQNTSTDTIRCMQSSAVTHQTGRLLTASGGAWALNLKDLGSTVVISTFAPAYVNTMAAMGFYCVNAGTNTVGSVALSQCK